MAESEYTPTTEEIINAWRYFRTENRAYDGDPEKEVRLWLAAHDAEVRAGVVAEEPEWEFGLADGGAFEPYSDYSADLDWLLDGVHPLDRGTIVLRRRKAGPWVPVEQGEGS